MINKPYKQHVRYLYLVVDGEIIYSCLKPVWLDNLESKNFLRYNFPKLTQDKTENLNSSMFIREAEFLYKIFTQRKLQGQIILLLIQSNV